MSREAKKADLAKAIAHCMVGTFGAVLDDADEMLEYYDHDGVTGSDIEALIEKYGVRALLEDESLKRRVGEYLVETLITGKLP